MKKLGMAILAVAMAAGCQTAPTSRYGDADDDVYGRKDKMEYTQQSRSVEDMIGQMLTDPDFSGFYEDAMARAAARGHKRPTVIVGKIEDNTRAGSNDYLSTSQMRTELKEALRKTRKFAVIDLQERARMKKTAGADADSGAAGDNLQSIGEYAAGDFTMEGELRMARTGGSYFHFFNLRMIDTASGEEAWSDTVRIRKD
jgi:PBP1b-binding outer membrane lipoprotein LpoB